MEFEIGEIVNMKKPHACGNYDWQILRVGADFRISCVKCGRQVMLTRQKFEKSLNKKVAEQGGK